MNITGMMRRRWGMVSSLLALTLVIGCGSPQGSKTKTKEEIMAEVEARAATVDNYRADLEMSMDMRGKNMVGQGKITLEKPNKHRTETVMNMGNMKMKQIVISNGKTTWTYQPDMKIVTKIDLEKIAAETGEQVPGNISNPFQSFQKESISYVRTEEMDGGGRKVYVFQGTSKNAEMQKVPATMEMWIGANDGLVRKMIILNPEGKEMMSMSYTNIDVNTKIADSLFEFTPPEGVQVTDMTERTIKMIKQKQGAGK